MIKTRTQMTSGGVTVQPGIPTTSKNMVAEAEAQTTGEDTMVGTGTQTLPAVIVLVMKKK